MASNIQVKNWTRTIAEQLFATNSVIQQLVNDSQYLSGKTVIRPQAGSMPIVKKNNTTFPLTAAEREDLTLEYDISEYTMLPVMLRQEDSETVSYDKRKSLIEHATMQVEDEVMANMLYDIAFDGTAGPATSVIKTTGAVRDADGVFGMTGVRKAFSYADALAARMVLNKQNIPSEGRVLLLPAHLENDIFKIDEFIDANKITVAVQKGNGFIGKIAGFDVYVRDRVTFFDASFAKRLITPTSIAENTATVAATDKHSALFFHKSMVAYALGTLGNGGVHVTYNADRADYGGAAVMTARVRAGASRVRLDYKGVGVIVED